MRYLCLGYFDEKAFNSMPAAERESFVETCFSYDDELRRGGHFTAGFALQANAAVTVRRRDGEPAVTEGPFAETREVLGGVLLLEATDLNHAIALMSRHPGLSAGPFEIRPIDEDFTARIAARGRT